MAAKVFLEFKGKRRWLYRARFNFTDDHDWEVANRTFALCRKRWPLAHIRLRVSNPDVVVRVCARSET